MMDSESSKPHKHPSRRSRKSRSSGGSSRRNKGAKRGGSSRREKRSSSRSTSSFAVVVPSKAPILSPTARQEPASCAAYLAGLLGVLILILLGGGDNSLGLGLALILPGVALFRRPPTVSCGKWMNVGIFGLLGSFLFAFLPLFYWPSPSWRKAAEEAFAIDLPSVLSVQPMVSFEALLLAVAGFAWFYAAVNWKINYQGRAKFYFWLSCVISGLAVVTILGNTSGWNYFRVESLEVFISDPNSTQNANFLAIGGVVAFGYAMEGLRARKLLHLSGFMATGLCLCALILGGAPTGVFLYFAGILIWFVLRIRQTSNSLFFKLGLPVVLLVFSVFIFSHAPTLQRMTNLMSAAVESENSSRVPLYKDTIRMIGDAPLTGVGLGNFPAVFSQHRNLSRNSERVVHPQSDVFWLATEGGLLAVVFLGIFIFAYFKRCLSAGSGRSRAYRTLALAAVILFVLHALIDVPGHRPSTAYFAMLFAALALPPSRVGRPSFKPVVWRAMGAVLLFVGVLWMAAGLFNWPLYSKSILAIEQAQVAESIKVGDYPSATQSVNKLIALQPLAWWGYSQRAQIILAQGSNRIEAARDFSSARFVEPTSGVVTYEAGQAWLPYDAERTISAWRETLLRDISAKDSVYTKMLADAEQSPELMAGMIELSQLNSNYRSRMLLFFPVGVFIRELRQDLALDPALGQFSREERGALVRRWITCDTALVIEVYLEAYGETLNRPWLVWSLLRKEQDRFKEAVEILRGALPVAELPKMEMDENAFAHLERGFSIGEKDELKGAALLRAYLDGAEYEKALQVTGVLLQLTNPPAYVYYWQAELLYQIGGYLESWYAFEAYIERLP